VGVDFIQNIKAHLKSAKLAISRTGAGALSDIIDCEIPSILIPIHHSNDPHYLNNAKVLVDKNAAILCLETEPHERLREIIVGLLKDPGKRDDLRANLKPLRYSQDPASMIAKHIKEKVYV
jgi:UDP-N-acetylglucosamine--N-acetylmuramyl-(pentapeptide) pyrophosphoryl-undecaprenol N-acetylglucosamine transferase